MFYKKKVTVYMSTTNFTKAVQVKGKKIELLYEVSEREY